jgi:hypothetical protein
MRRSVASPRSPGARSRSCTGAVPGPWGEGRQRLRGRAAGDDRAGAAGLAEHAAEPTNLSDDTKRCLT